MTQHLNAINNISQLLKELVSGKIVQLHIATIELNQLTEKLNKQTALLRQKIKQSKEEIEKLNRLIG